VDFHADIGDGLFIGLCCYSGTSGWMATMKGAADLEGFTLRNVIVSDLTHHASEEPRLVSSTNFAAIVGLPFYLTADLEPDN
jgi:hypothetical protein